MPEDVVTVDDDVRREVAGALRRSGYIQEQDIGDDALFDALSAYIRTENFEERERRRLSRPGCLGVHEGAELNEPDPSSPNAATTVPFHSGGESPESEE